MNTNFDLKQVEDSLEHYAHSADQRVAEFEEVLGRLVARFESIMDSVGRIIARAKEQKDHLLEFKDKTLKSVEPVVNAVAPAAAKTRDTGKKLVSRYKEDPTPFLVGAALVAGGLLVTGYYLNRSRSDDSLGETESLRGIGQDDPEFAANAS